MIWLASLNVGEEAAQIALGEYRLAVESANDRVRGGGALVQEVTIALSGRTAQGVVGPTV